MLMTIFLQSKETSSDNGDGTNHTVSRQTTGSSTASNRDGWRRVVGGTVGSSNRGGVGSFGGGDSSFGGRVSGVWAAGDFRTTGVDGTGDGGIDVGDNDSGGGSSGGDEESDSRELHF
ncbi:hypothetical protein DASC09_042390 [Saccharomycopsis crataegensis]|uniref:Uncharacterized protein n=1 Tax=Saccharomycopsis crataegensis TaxID=43959 RepID=A0AAV5QR58_9ASCO|nr:hypothetical protein DASC09_042390 [Saccharomycopsis crataegensis]